MPVAGENSEADVARRRARDRIDWPLRELTANLIRVTRGAGKPYEIARQTRALLQAFIDYQESIGHFPPADELSGLLSIDRDLLDMEKMNEEHLDRYFAEQSIIDGSLQIAASWLLGQKTQEVAGSSEMY